MRKLKRFKEYIQLKTISKNNAHKLARKSQNKQSLQTWRNVLKYDPLDLRPCLQILWRNFTMTGLWNRNHAYNQRCRKINSEPQLLQQPHSFAVHYVVTKLNCSILIITCITRDIILTMIPIVERYRYSHRRPKTRHEINYLEHTRWILKDTIRRTYNLIWFCPNLDYVHGEKT